MAVLRPWQPEVREQARAQTDHLRVIRLHQRPLFLIFGFQRCASLSQGLGGGKSDAFQAGIYGATKSGPAYLAAAFAFTNHWMSTDRIAFASDHLTADFNAQSYALTYARTPEQRELQRSVS